MFKRVSREIKTVPSSPTLQSVSLVMAEEDTAYGLDAPLQPFDQERLDVLRVHASQRVGLDVVEEQRGDGCSRRNVQSLSSWRPQLSQASREAVKM